MTNKTVLIINGTDDKYSYASKGELNALLADTSADYLKDKGYKILRTTIKDGYNPKEEDEKWKEAGYIIFQFPVYWFSAPAVLKRYFEDIYNGGQYYKGGTEYGRGGLLTDKKYMISTTWNAQLETFKNENSFFKGESIDEVLAAFHYTHSFIGLEKLPSFSVNDVVRNPNVRDYISKLKLHLSNVFN